MVAILVANGFECAEALVTLDLLHRAEINAELIALDGKQVASANCVLVKSDRVLTEGGVEAVLSDLDMLILAGGIKNVTTLRGAPEARELITKAAAKGIYLAAICAAPLILAELGLLNHRNIVCYPGMEAGMFGAKVQAGSKVVVDGRIITGQGPGAVFDFALKLVEILKDTETMQRVKHEIHYQD